MMNEPPQEQEPKEPPAPRPGRSERREAAAKDALRTLIRDSAERAFGHHAIPAVPFDLTVRVSVNPAGGWDLKADPSLQDQLHHQLADMSADHESFIPGRVHCFRCNSSTCEHAAPTSPLEVFKGYTQTGSPQWQELTQALIDLKDDRVDRLYGRHSAVVAAVVNGSALKSSQLTSFGKASKTYAVLGQVVAGYFTSGETDRFAITFQFVEIRRARGVVGLRLNTLCALSSGRSLEERFAEGWGGWVHRAEVRATAALGRLEQQLASAPSGGPAAMRHAFRRVPGVMAQLATSLDRGYRQNQRRTRHSEERRQQQRPVHKAIEDAQGAPDHELLYDEKSNAYIVSGQRGRFHVFSLEGRHITSFTGRPGTVDFRLRTQRWRRLAKGEQQAFRTRLNEADNLSEKGEESGD
jgi:hypothetical protein